MIVNLFKVQKLTNIRSADAEEAVRITLPRKMSLEEALEYFKEDELVEIGLGFEAALQLEQLCLRHRHHRHHPRLTPTVTSVIAHTPAHRAARAVAGSARPVASARSAWCGWRYR